MHINEDYIEDIETDGLHQEEVTAGGVFHDKEHYQFGFYFRSSDSDVDMTDNEWKSAADQFLRTVHKSLDEYPVIQDFSHDIPIYIGLWYYGQ